VNAALPKLKELGVETLIVSSDTKFSHKRFTETEPLMENFEIMMGADGNGRMAKDYGVYLKAAGLAIRGRFIIDPDGVVVAQEVLSPPVGRNINELIRQIEAFQHVAATGEACPANWRKGKKTLPVGTDEAKMTGRVGDYVTIEEIVS
jgi:peroxiredoxin (alkyl hydroperoxide reductase subunit C)